MTSVILFINGSFAYGITFCGDDESRDAALFGKGIQAGLDAYAVPDYSVFQLPRDMKTMVRQGDAKDAGFLAWKAKQP